MKILKCNCCGSEINNTQRPYGIGVHTRIGYGSKFDGQEIDLDLCSDCLDKIMNYMNKKFKYSPVLKNN